ncbi:NlpC/P60 family protein [Paracoccus sp. M683]|uniref:C40 family peptidase n=1 Tax=Paracoccus sp. M683 TaxID=2594268 RepID=UPI00117F84DE|nr:C40 family peptidase [Paracoccus sp. M683]TRW98850.1 NlpC/P60 family protein [Paracoccus sp. M683]
MNGDPRLTPATDRIALSSLHGVLDRPAYTDGVPMRVAVPLAELCRTPAGARDRQLNFGADVTVIDEEGPDGWFFVQAAADGYCGWTTGAALSDQLPPLTHRVSAAATHLYPAPDMKTHQYFALSIGARLAVEGFEGKFARLATGGYVPVQHITDRDETDPVAVALRLLGTPYLWGGNSDWGIDCSGLVQCALAACGIACPGDTDLQRKAGKPVEGAPQPGDLLFWPRHVAMVIDADRMIHANAHTMAVTIEGIEAAKARIEAAGEGPFQGARRFSAG